MQKFDVFRGIKRAGVTKIAFFCVFFCKISANPKFPEIFTFSEKWDSLLAGEKHRNPRNFRKSTLFLRFLSEIVLAGEIDAAVKSGVFRCFFACKHVYPVSPCNYQKTENRLKIHKNKSDARLRVGGRN